MRDSYITKIFDARSRIKEVTYSLKYKAQALSTIGMQDLSESLFSYANEIEYEVDGIIDNVTNQIDNEFRQSQKTIGETFNFLLKNAVDGIPETTDNH
jgi:hypothetical protein